MNSNWPRWIKASIAKSFSALAQANELLLFIEGTDRDPNPPKSFAELRVDGPFIKQVNPHYWVIDIDINILLQVTLDDEDIYNMERVQGIMLKGFVLDFPVYQLGDSDDTYVGCLVARTDGRQNVYIANFGQRQPGVRLQQSSITGGYRMEIDDEN